MGIFDREQEEPEGEVRIRAEPEENGEESRLKKEAERKLIGSSDNSSNDESDTSGMLPGMGSSASSSTTDINSGDISLDDVHSQNERIIELLQDIKSELGGTSNGLL